MYPIPSPFRLGIIIPDRPGREVFTKQCFHLIGQQTIREKAVVYEFAFENAPPISDKPDITWRYRTGYEKFRGRGFDLIAFWENDDWYAPDYLEYMISEWVKAGTPDLFGTCYTIYYNLRVRKYFRMFHATRASAMNTFIKPDLDVPWPDDHEAFTDVALWDRMLSRKVIEPDHIIAVGMKHGIGMCGGRSHTDRLYRYINEDNGFLQNTMDKESVEFYNELTKTVNVE